MRKPASRRYMRYHDKEQTFADLRSIIDRIERATTADTKFSFSLTVSWMDFISKAPTSITWARRLK